jgi:dGTPase
MPTHDSSLFVPPDWLEREDELLAPYAMRTRQSLGRRHPEPAHPFRTLYQRDRDRIIHSTAFRRLMYKTQVLVNQASDYHRTRLTHTLEVVQISRTAARQLGLNEDLTEAIALMHDLGHPPFGHAGEQALDAAMANHGGFEHNRHGLRIVEELEYRYAEFPGLNLSHELREAQAQHSSRPESPEIAPYLGQGQPLLEAQIVDASDSLAYNCHDLDDALNIGLITLDQLAAVAFWAAAAARVRQKYAQIRPEQFQPAVIRALIDWQVTDLLEQTRQNLASYRIHSVADVRRAPQPIVAAGPEVASLKAELEIFLRVHVYRHYRVMRMAHKGRRILQRLFEEYCERPEQLPTRYAERAAAGALEQTVCDYLAGMTDRYAQDEYLRLFQPYTPL